MFEWHASPQNCEHEEGYTTSFGDFHMSMVRNGAMATHQWTIVFWPHMAMIGPYTTREQAEAAAAAMITFEMSRVEGAGWA